jgi:hypothetical protein
MWYNVPLDTLVSDDDDTRSKCRAELSDTHVGLFRFKVLYWRASCK